MKTIIIILLFAFASLHSIAQIVYTNVNPDSIIDNKSYNLDLNNAGIADFIMIDSSWQSCAPGQDDVEEITPLNNNAVLSDSKNHPYALHVNDTITSNSVSWLTSGNQILAKFLVECLPRGGGFILHQSGHWFSTKERYLGLKLIKGINTYYGWIGLLNTPVNVTAYAFNSIPNQPILAGETSCTTPTVKLKAGGSLSFCNGDSVCLTANDTGYLYQWKKDGKNIEGATSQTYIAKTPGIYKCKVTNSCGSKTSKEDTVAITCKGLSNNITADERMNTQSLHFTIAPNPVSNSTTISFNLQSSQKVSITIYDMNGRLIKTLADQQMQQGLHQLTWNARSENVITGTYLLKLQTGNNVQTKKISVVH